MFSVPTRTTIAFLLLTTAALAQNRPIKQPNIVLIVADDQGYNSVGYHDKWVQTPQIDRLANMGVALERYYVSPMCSPTRAGLMTGRYPMRYGMGRSVVRPWARYGLPPEEVTIPEVLAGAGYKHRGLFGKWHLGHLAPQWHPLAQGFTDFIGVYNGAADYWTRERNGEIDWHVNHTPDNPKGYTTDLIADAAAAFIRKNAADGPFFCYVPFTAPHDPHQAPASYLSRYTQLDDNPADGKPSDLQALAAMITCMDDGIGRVVKALEETGTISNTLVWFMSDNGGLQRLRNVNAPLREGKLTVYEGGVRVPSAVWWPGVIEGGRKIDAPVMNIDVLPTLMRAVGGTCPSAKSLDGVDVLDILTGRTQSAPARDMYFFTGQSGIDKEQIAIISREGWKLVVLGPDIRRPEGFRTALHHVELFNLSTDPGESKNLAASEPDRVAVLGQKLIQFRKSEPPKPLMPQNVQPRGFTAPPGWEIPLASKPTE